MPLASNTLGSSRPDRRCSVTANHAGMEDWAVLRGPPERAVPTPTPEHVRTLIQEPAWTGGRGLTMATEVRVLGGGSSAHPVPHHVQVTTIHKGGEKQ